MKKHTAGTVIAFVLILAAMIAAYFGIVKLDRYLDSIVTSDSAAVKRDAEKTGVIIDAGHGGADGGASGFGDFTEKELNLLVAKQIKALLVFENVDVIMTRSEDVMLRSEGAASVKNGDLKARYELAEKSGNNLLVSIHMNKFPQESVRGITLYYSPNNMQSKPLAECVKNGLVCNIQPNNKRPMKEAGSSIYILHRTSKPAILIECGFLSNREEALLLGTEEYRCRLSAVIASALAEFIAENCR